MDESKLKENIKTIMGSAELVYANNDYTSATILYFKVLFGVLDFILLKAVGKAPKDHSERFKMLQSYNPNLYEIIDKYFKVYRDTYSTRIDKETCNQVRKNVQRIIQEYKIQV